MRRARTFSRHSQIRLTFIAGGLAVGAVAVGFALLADQVQDLFQHTVDAWRFAAVVATPLGFATSAYVARRYFPNSGGSGIPQAIAARALSNETERQRLVSLRVAAGKILLTALGLLCGGSIGREGPTVQVGASVMYAVGHISPRRQKGLILAGAAAGVAAAFNTPLAGIVFGIEEMGRSFESRTSGIVIGTVIAAGLVSLASGGLAGGVFSRIVVAAAGPWTGGAGRWLKARPALLAGGCGLGVAVCGLASHETIYGTGYGQVVHMLNGGVLPPADFGLMKFAATLLSAVSGIPGGIFSPSLAVGAGLGLNLAHVMSAVPLPVMAVLGMVAYFAGVVQAPITAFVIVTEMTNDHAMLVPLMLTSLIAHAMSRQVCQEGIYHALARNYLPSGQAH